MACVNVGAEDHQFRPAENVISADFVRPSCKAITDRSP